VNENVAEPWSYEDDMAQYEADRQSDTRRPHSGKRRFYWADGRVEWRRVDVHNGRLPGFWRVPVMSPALPPNLDVDGLRRLSVKTASFERIDYGHSIHFIGPHRDSDYHQAGA
jgi:hypothetical protein